MKETNTALIDRIITLLRSKKASELLNILKNVNETDLALIMQELYEDEDLTQEELTILFRMLPKDMAADVFIEMDSDLQETLIQAFNDAELRDVINDMFADDAADIIEEMPANVVKRILRTIDPKMRKDVNALLNYPEDSAGSIMTTEYVSLKKDMTVEACFSRIRKTGVDKETIYTCYVTEPSNKLLGLVSVKDLLLAKYEDTVENIMTTNIISCHTLDDQEEVVQMFKRYSFTALPVVDNEDRLVGIVTIDDAIYVMEEEATEDIAKMAAVTPSEKAYLKTGIFETYKSRIPWLLLLMVSATFTSTIINHFEEALAATVILTAFIPMLMDTAGNTGGQSSVTIIRSISLGEVQFTDLPQIIWKEIRVAVLCGATLSLTNFAKLMLLDRVGFSIAMVVCLTLAVTIVCAKIVGCVLPMVAKKIGFDPAVMASPFITTIVDAIALLFYFQIASAILGL